MIGQQLFFLYCADRHRPDARRCITFHPSTKRYGKKLYHIVLFLRRRVILEFRITHYGEDEVCELTFYRTIFNCYFFNFSCMP